MGTPSNTPHRSLASPTAPGQTTQLTRLSGAAVASALWDRLPYYLRGIWGERVDACRAADVLAYIKDDASPVALSAAKDNPRLSDTARQAAAERLATLGLSDADQARLDKHHRTLLTRPRSRLLTHLAGAERADAAVDRLDLLAEVVALRDAQADVQTERSLVRAFRAMFRTRDPFVVWVLVSLTLAAFVLLKRVDESGAIYQTLSLPPNLARPWALLTYPFVHLPAWQHVVLNMAALILVGQILEQVLGHARFLGVYLLCAVGGGLVSILFRLVMDLPVDTVGASGAISGLAGMALFVGLWFQRRYGRIPLRYTTATLVGGVILVSNVLVSATAGTMGVDHGAHLGGLCVGLGIGAALLPTLARQADQRFGRHNRRT